jgi:hypothetical protein
MLAMYGSGGDANGPNVCNALADDTIAPAAVCDGVLGKAECMTCFLWGELDQMTVRSAHVGGAFLAMCDGSVTFISDDVETSGVNGPWGTPWDYMIASGDAEQVGPYSN